MIWYVEVIQENMEINKIIKYKITKVLDIDDIHETTPPLFCQIFCYPYDENTYTKVPVFNDSKMIAKLISEYGPYFDEITKLENDNRIEYLLFISLKEKFKLNLQYLHKNGLLDPIALALYPEKTRLAKSPLINVKWYRIIGIQNKKDFSNMQNITKDFLEKTFLKSYEFLDFIPGNLFFNEELLSNKFLMFTASFCHEIHVCVGEDGIIKIIRCKGNITEFN
jgi:hypothetical protein